MKLANIIEAAKRGVAASQFALGTLYQNGVGGTVDWQAAMEWYERAATQGFAAAEYSLSLMYAGSGRFSAPSPNAFKKSGTIRLEWADDYWSGRDEEAFSWCLRAAEHNFVPAQYTVATYFELGYGTPANLDQALNWYLRAAQSGWAEGARDAAFMYQEGRGVQMNIKKAFFWYAYAAKLGDGLSAWVLANYYLHGMFVTKNTKKGLSWIRYAAKLNSPDAHLALSNGYSQGLYGLDIDLGKSEEHRVLYKRYSDEETEKNKFTIGTV